MKKRTAMMMIAAILAVQFTAAQEPVKKYDTAEKKIAFATKNLLCGLHSTNPGLVESAMRITAQMTLKYQSADMSALSNALNTIWQSNPSGAMRYKAYIAMSICENPEWYRNDSTITGANEETFFFSASARMRQQLLSDNN